MTDATIYLVVGSSGAYDEWEQWYVKAFRNEQKAEDFCGFLRDLMTPFEEKKKELDAGWVVMVKTLKGKAAMDAAREYHERLAENSVAMEEALKPHDPGVCLYSNSVTYEIKKVPYA